MIFHVDFNLPYGVISDNLFEKEVKSEIYPKLLALSRGIPMIVVYRKFKPSIK